MSLLPVAAQNERASTMGVAIAAPEVRFKDRLKASRERRKLTLKQLGNLSGVSQQSIWNYENRGDEPSAVILFALADALGVDPRWLLSGAGEREVASAALPKDVVRIASAIVHQTPEKKHALAVLLGVTFESDAN
jgi:transcriptional regulator with XRE-family HTH domain